MKDVEYLFEEMNMVRPEVSIEYYSNGPDRQFTLKYAAGQYMNKTIILANSVNEFIELHKNLKEYHDSGMLGLLELKYKGDE